MHSFNCRKAPGPSKVPAWALKDGCNELNTYLTFLYNEFLKNKTHPCQLKKSNCHTNIKKEDRKLPQNYRPISITGALSKVLKNCYINKSTNI